MMMREVFMRSGAVNKVTAIWDGVLPFAGSAAALVALLEVFAR